MSIARNATPNFGVQRPMVVRGALVCRSWEVTGKRRQLSLDL